MRRGRWSLAAVATVVIAALAVTARAAYERGFREGLDAGRIWARLEEATEVNNRR